jgi:hypothetical protein
VAGSDGWVATQASLQPKIACLSLMPFKANNSSPACACCRAMSLRRGNNRNGFSAGDCCRSSRMLQRKLTATARTASGHSRRGRFEATCPSMSAAPPTTTVSSSSHSSFDQIVGVAEQCRRNSKCVAPCFAPIATKFLHSRISSLRARTRHGRHSPLTRIRQIAAVTNPRWKAARTDRGLRPRRANNVSLRSAKS